MEINKRQPTKRGSKKDDEIIEMKVKRKRRRSKTRYNIKENNKSRNLMLLNNNQNSSSTNFNNINNNNHSDKNIKIENDFKANIWEIRTINVAITRNIFLNLYINKFFVFYIPHEYDILFLSACTKLPSKTGCHPTGFHI